MLISTYFTCSFIKIILFIHDLSLKLKLLPSDIPLFLLIWLKSFIIFWEICVFQPKSISNLLKNFASFNISINGEIPELVTFVHSVNSRQRTSSCFINVLIDEARLINPLSVILFALLNEILNLTIFDAHFRSSAIMLSDLSVKF